MFRKSSRPNQPLGFFAWLIWGLVEMVKPFSLSDIVRQVYVNSAVAWSDAGIHLLNPNCFLYAVLSHANSGTRSLPAPGRSPRMRPAWGSASAFAGNSQASQRSSGRAQGRSRHRYLVHSRRDHGWRTDAQTGKDGAFKIPAVAGRTGGWLALT